MIAHTPDHVQIDHGHDSLQTVGEVDAPSIIVPHPIEEELRAYKPLFLGSEKGEDDATGRAYLLEMTSQLEYNSIAAGIVVGTRMNAQRVGTARA